MAESNLTAERLRELLSYDPETGIFVWLTRRRKCRIGKAAGTVSHGYIVIKLDRVMYRAHRLAFLWMTGEWPTEQVDHRDRDRANNRWKNLRQATTKQNSENMKVLVTNTSGHTGVQWIRRDKKWRAVIGSDGKTHVLGRAAALEDAIKLRELGERKYFTHSAKACKPPNENL